MYSTDLFSVQRHVRSWKQILSDSSFQIICMSVTLKFAYIHSRLKIDAYEITSVCETVVPSILSIDDVIASCVLLQLGGDKIACL